ncbi:family 78 glycoside hydrolase catalytic domain [Amycolatopsis sp., V23-08]|uniref:alpha-L-rhamnosidase n=1 Tax=Amycolatopsis heterodermiae TaxID=3110235 RepID=A0ABU5RGI1_9PSEU|nr:family 78 glycoside hydrolase catalytic domain [Amycolatopsis sp., V23-08]MEA5365386.1 family 78 glycoside hydrolase catalytic domain [Amycolatopsis sp., V23-08]
MRSRVAGVSAVLVVLLAVSGSGTALAGQDRHAGLDAGALTVEHQADPLGVDVAKPRLGWELNSDQPGARQSAYQVQVSSAPNRTGDVWDSGRVPSAKSFDVAYAGAGLRSRTRYYWRVRVWDATGRTSDWSDAAWFETAFLTGADFHGDWIGARAEPVTTSLQGANWIWYPQGNPADSAPVGTRYFRRAFDVPAGVTAAHIQLTADDNFVLSLNGKQVASSPPVADSWRTAVDVDLTADLRPGRNVLAIQAANAQPGPSGLVGKLHVETSSGTPVDIVTDAAWKASDTDTAGWQQPDFDDSAWPAALVAAAYGSGPWGNSVTATTPPEPLLRKDFTANKKIRSARAYIAGLGYYKLYLNGRRVGDHELDPAFTVYDKTDLYATYDVTQALRSGANTIGVSLGRGYYAMTNPDEWLSSPWHGEPKLKLELDVTYTDGTSGRVVSDGSWTLADGPTTSESLWFGETHDARLEQPGWNDTGFDASAWRPARVVPAPAGTLRAQAFPPIKVTDTLGTGKVTTPAAGTTVHDFGSPTAGWAGVGVRGPAGAQVTITYGEKLKADGTVDNIGGFGMQLQKYTYILKGGGPETFTPSYSYAGFQYVQVTAPAGVTVDAVTGQRVHTAVAKTGDFTSSSDLLNRYHAAEANTILNNLHSVPTDTPMYEKRPYTADAFLAADAAIGSFDMENFYENWMRAHRDDQTPEGNIGQTVPGTVGAKQVIDPVWSASFVLVDWDLYWYYGDIQPLADNYEAMKAWLGFFEKNIAKTGYIYTGGSYADWLAPGFAQPPEGARLAGTAYLHKTTTTMAAIARALGHNDDAARFDQLAGTIAGAFNATFYDASKGAYFDDPAAGYRQTSNLLPLSLGIVPAAARAGVVANLVGDIKGRGVHLNTGALGTKLILPVLTETGNSELAYSVATNPTYPGWGYWFQALGATTMWEEWQAGSRSHQHAFMGTVDDWLYQDVAGIEPAAPGYTKVKIQPSPVGDLRQASAHVDSPLGPVRSDWTRDRNRFTLRVSVPVGATGEVFVPVGRGQRVNAPAGATAEGTQNGYARYRVGSGSYEFRAIFRAG